MNRRRRKQMAFHDSPIGFQGARIFPGNRWVKLATLVPWDLVDEVYATNFAGSKKGNVAIDSRIAFGALIIKEELCLSDEETVRMICENPHCQYFLGLAQFTDVTPFDPSKMVAFRRRFPAEAVSRINEAIILAQRKAEDKSSSNDEDPGNRGTLILDATCAPADVHYPTDASVLNEARLLSERLIDELHDSSSGQTKPRTYRQNARKNYLLLARSKRPGYRLIRATLRAQLQFIRRNLGHIEAFRATCPLTERQEAKLAVVQQVHDQQREMYDLRRHRVPNRVVSVSQPHVRPIVRGKRSAKVEFGAKIALSLEDGYARIEKLSWDAFNESLTLQDSCERYRLRYGYYPERVLVDKIYRTRANLRYCAAHGITLNGPRLGRPPKDRTLYDQQKRQERLDAGERNAIEGKFGEAKRRYGLNRVMTRQAGSSETTITIIVLVMNLKKVLRDLFCVLLPQLFQKFQQRYNKAFAELAFGQ